MPSLTTSLGVSNDPDLPTFKDLIDTHNENKQLRSELDQTTASLGVLVDYIALSNPDFNGLSEKHKYIIAKEHDMKITTVESQLKARRKKFAHRRRTLHRKYKHLNWSTASQNQSSFSGVRPRRHHRLPTGQSSKAGQRNDEQIRPQSSSSASSDESESATGEESATVHGSDNDNILPPVIIHPVLDESVRINVHGKLLTQKGLAQFYQAKGLDESGKRSFMTNNIKINEMRMRID